MSSDRSMFSLGAVLRLAATLAAGVVLFFLISAWIGDRTQVHVDWLPTREIDLLAPHWLLLICVVPAFYLLRVLSLTDLSLAQQLLQSTLRSLVITGVAIALARPTWITEQKKVSTIVLVDVSDSVSEKQLDAARKYVASVADARDGGNLQVVSFAEKPQVVRVDEGKSLADSIKRHPGAGAGTDTQAAMQLAYGLYPDGYLSRMLIVTDGNQTVGDLAVEAYRAKDLGVRSRGERSTRTRPARSASSA